MNHKSIFNLMLALFAVLLSVSVVNAQISDKEPSKEDIKFWKSKAKGYTKNPMALKHEFDAYQKQITELKAQIAQMNAEFEAKGAESSAYQTQLDSLKWENVHIKSEKYALEKKMAKMEIALKGEKKVNETGTKLGLVYRTQIGAFVNHEMSSVPANADDFKHEKSDGFNKYMLGNFRTQQEAEAFSVELKKVGIADAWAVPYIDGIRVTFAEANTYLSKQPNFNNTGGGEKMAAPGGSALPPK